MISTSGSPRIRVSIHHLVQAKRFPLVEGVRRVAIHASQVAGRQPDEDARQPRERALALQAAVDLMDHQRARGLLLKRPQPLRVPLADDMITAWLPMLCSSNVFHLCNLAAGKSYFHHPVHPGRLGLDELDIQERVGRDPLEPDVALGVDQEGAVQRLVLEVVEGPIPLEELEPGSASMGMGNLTPSGLFLSDLVASMVSVLIDSVSTFSFSGRRTVCRRLEAAAGSGRTSRPGRRLPGRSSPELGQVPGVSVVSIPESGPAGEGDQTSGPTVFRSIRPAAVSSVPVAGSAVVAVHVLSAFQRATIGSSRRKTGRSRSAHLASGSSRRYASSAPLSLPTA